MKTGKKRKKAVMTPLRSDRFCDDDSVCYVEEFFVEFLVFERRRSERSGRPFLVMTIDFTSIPELESRKESVKLSMKTLSVLTRDTDIKGWYRESEILGVIFTEMNSLETETLQKKIYTSLHASLTEEQLSVIRISVYRFPDEGKPDKPGKTPGFTFYPDYPKQEQARKTALQMKRVMDLVGSIVGIVLFSPFFILIPIVIKLTSRGPVLFRQKRIGQYEKPFMFLKFRSMYAGNNEDVHKEFVHNLICKKTSGDDSENISEKKVYKITNDARVTTIGKIIRKTSLDELPQFFNVLKGEMSLAGPRPPIPYELEKYDSWHRRRVLEIKPGITGLWQIMGRSSTSFDEMVRLDSQYATNWSLWLDIKILLKTPWALVAGKGAY